MVYRIEISFMNGMKQTLDFGNHPKLWNRAQIALDRLLEQKRAAASFNFPDGWASFKAPYVIGYVATRERL